MRTHSDNFDGRSTRGSRRMHTIHSLQSYSSKGTGYFVSEQRGMENAEHLFTTAIA